MGWRYADVTVQSDQCGEHKLAISPITNWQPVQGISRLFRSDSRVRLQLQPQP